MPALDQCRIKFNEVGDVIYGAMFDEAEENAEDEHRSAFGCSFRTFDADDYSNIATIDIKRPIFDLAVAPGETLIAVIENQTRGDPVALSDGVCRLYEVGRLKEDDDESGESDVEEEDDLADEDSDDDDGDNLDNTDEINPEDTEDEIEYELEGDIEDEDEDANSISDSEYEDSDSANSLESESESGGSDSSGSYESDE